MNKIKNHLIFRLIIVQISSAVIELFNLNMTSRGRNPGVIVLKRERMSRKLATWTGIKIYKSSNRHAHLLFQKRQNLISHEFDKTNSYQMTFCSCLFQRTSFPPICGLPYPVFLPTSIVTFPF